MRRDTPISTTQYNHSLDCMLDLHSKTRKNISEILSDINFWQRLQTKLKEVERFICSRYITGMLPSIRKKPRIILLGEKIARNISQASCRRAWTQKMMPQITKNHWELLIKVNITHFFHSVTWSPWVILSFHASPFSFRLFFSKNLALYSACFYSALLPAQVELVFSNVLKLKIRFFLGENLLIGSSWGNFEILLLRYCPHLRNTLKILLLYHPI